MEILSMLFLALEYWLSYISNSAIYNVSSRYGNSWFSVVRGLLSSILFFDENLKLVEVYWQLKALFFSSHLNLDLPKFPKCASTFILSHQDIFDRNYRIYFFHLVHQGQTQKSFCFRGGLVLLTILPVTCNWLLIVEKTQEVFFRYGAFSISKARFRHNY